MNKKVLTLLSVLFISAGALSAASMRDYVCVVRGQYSEAKKEYLENYSKKLISAGYADFGRYITEYLEGTFGSGFIYYASNGKPFIITNRHVINDYQSADISFENDDGSTSEFKNLKIFAISRDFDLAMIQLPDAFRKPGLQLKEGAVTDGLDVYSAGFPGLGGKPSWQLGKGVVSNGTARIRELINPEVSTIIQHTAEIDGGNSGGPLLVADSSAAAGYLVTGVNTWKVVDRQNTNFAIPASLVKKFAEESIKAKSEKSVQTVSDEFLKTVSDKESGFVAVYKYISDSMVETYGDSAFRTSLNQASTEDRAEVISAFRRGPLEGLRYALCLQVWVQFYHYDQFQQPKDISFEASALGQKVKYTFENDKSVTAEWTETDCGWQISRLSSILTVEEKAAKKKASGSADVNVEISDPYLFCAKGAVNFSLSGGNISGYGEIDYDCDFLSIGAVFGKNSMKYEDYTYNFLEFELNARVQVPVRLNDFILEPFVQGDAGVRIDSVASGSTDSRAHNLNGMFFGAEAGLEFVYCTPWQTGIVLGAEYFYKNSAFAAALSDESIYGKPASQGISVYAGLKFFER